MSQAMSSSLQVDEKTRNNRETYRRVHALSENPEDPRPRCEKCARPQETYVGAFGIDGFLCEHCRTWTFPSPEELHAPSS